MNDVELRRNPYVGLRPFFVEDSLYFFGREQQTAELLQILHDNRFLGVVGSSGSGKSSLVRAGLLPALLGGFLVQERDRWHVAQMRPGDAPVANLAKSLLQAMADYSAHEDDPKPGQVAVARFEQQIREDHTAAVLEFVESQLKDNANVFLLVDQFEEIFAFRGIESDDDQSGDPARRRERARRKAEAADFVDLILALASQRQLPVYVALTMRTDFLGDCDLFYGLPEALNRGRYLVPRMTRQQLAKAIEGPAKLLRARVAPRLLDHLLNELGDRFDRLPVLQHALLRTWDTWRNEGGIGPIDLPHFKSAGELERALDQDAERAIEGLDAAAAERVFKRLTGTDRNQRRVRSPARISELMAASGADRQTIEGIVRRFEQDGRSFLHASDDGRPDDPRVDISHESLIRQWNRLRGWVDEERDSRDQYVELVARARRWERGEAALLVDPELQTALGLRKRTRWSPAWAERYAFGRGDFPRAMAYLAKSVDRRRAIRAAFGFVALLLFAGALWMSVGIVRHEELAEREAFWREAPDAPRDSRLFGFLGHMYASLESGDVQGARTLLDGLDTLKKESLPHGDGAGGANSVWDEWKKTRGDRSVEGLLLDKLKEEAALLRAPDAANDLINTRGPRAAIYGVTLGADGAFVLSTLRDGTVRLWNRAEGEKVIDLPGCGLQPREAFARLQRPRTVAAAYSPAAKMVAVACSDGSLPDWNQSSARDVAIVGPVPRDVLSLALSPGGEYLVTGSIDGTASVWEVKPADSKQGRTHPTLGSVPLAVLRGHSDAISSVAFASAGFGRGEYRVVTGSRDRTARVWKITGSSIERYEPLRGHTDWVTSAAFDADGSRVVTTSYDGTTRLWDVDPARPGRRQPVLIQNRTDSVASAALSADGKQIITALRDGTVLAWDAAGGGRQGLGEVPLRLDLDRFIDRLNFEIADKIARKGKAAELSPSESNLVTFYEKLFSGTARASETKEALQRLASEEPYASAARAAWRLSGELDDKNLIRGLFTAEQKDRHGRGSRDRIAELTAGYRAESDPYARRVVLRGHGDKVTSAAFGPDGSRVVTASYDGTARVWDAATGRQILVLRVERPDKLTSARFSPDGKRIVTTSYDSKVRLWSATDGKSIAVFSDHKEAVYGAAFSPDGTWLASAARDGVRLWQQGSAPDSWSLQQIGLSPCGPKEGADAMHRHSVASVVFSPDGKRVATASNDTTARLCNWDGKSLEQAFQTPARARPCDDATKGHCETVHTVAFSPDGRYVVTASYDRSARVWDAGTGEQLLVLGDHGGRVYSAAFNPRDKSRIATVSADGFIRIWEVSLDKGAKAARLVQKVAGGSGEIFSAAWSGEGVRLIVTSEDGTAAIWGERLDATKFATPFHYEVACALAGPELDCKPLPKSQRTLSAPEEANLLASAYFGAGRLAPGGPAKATYALDALSEKFRGSAAAVRSALAWKLDSVESEPSPAGRNSSARGAPFKALRELVWSGGGEPLRAVATGAAAMWLLSLVVVWPLWRVWVWYRDRAGGDRTGGRVANPVRRLFAGVVDLALAVLVGLAIGGLLGILTWIFLSAAGVYPGYRGWNIGVVAFACASAGYLMLRDASLSAGKMLFGLRSISVASAGERQASFEQSVLRNVFAALFYVLALLPCAALVLGAYLFVPPAGVPSSGWRDAGYLLVAAFQERVSARAWAAMVVALTVVGIVELVLAATNRGRTLHDQIAKTGVIDVRRRALDEDLREEMQTAAA